MSDHRHEESPRGSGGGFFAGFITGAMAGAVIAYLITQEEARDAIAGKAREAANMAMDYGGDLRANAADLYARGKTVVENARGNADAAAEQSQTQPESPITDS